MRLVYEKPASRWGEALPLGNGQIGAMVYGGADCEEIDLTEHTFYSGEAEKTCILYTFNAADEEESVLVWAYIITLH